MKRKSDILKIFLFLGDIFSLYFALFLTLAIRRGSFSFFETSQKKAFLFHFSIIYIFWLLFLFILDFFEIPSFRKISEFLSRLAIFAFLAGSLGTIYFYLQPQLTFTPKTILFLDVLIFSFLLFFWRFFINYLLRLKNFKERVVIIGYPHRLKELTPEFLSQQGFRVSALFLPNFSFFEKPDFLVVSDIQQLKEIIEKEKVTLAVFALDFREDKKLAQEIFANLPLKLNYLSFVDFYELLKKKIPLELLDEIWFLENLSRPEKKIYAFFKRIFDIVFSFVGFCFFCFFFPFIALAVKIDSPGPVFYSQKRKGKDGRVFTLYKFRTMKETESQDTHLWREKEEGHVTRVGAFLRRTHLDELPQFLSILKGDLSFVGPRPEWVELAKIFEKEIPFYRQRYLIKPGLTGWAQLNFPPSLSILQAKEKFEYDLYYLKNRSFFLDIEIIFKTARIFFR